MDSNLNKRMKLIPCYRKEDGEIGMFDLISNSFLTNQLEGELTGLPKKEIEKLMVNV